jgi:hypothetical protein
MYVAELHGKLDVSGSTSLDRSEDTLTAAVFGALRYLPASALLAVLNRAFPGDFKLADIRTAPHIVFWPWMGDIEPDV